MVDCDGYWSARTKEHKDKRRPSSTSSSSRRSRSSMVRPLRQPACASMPASRSPRLRRTVRTTILLAAYRMLESYVASIARCPAPFQVVDAPTEEVEDAPKKSRPTVRGGRSASLPRGRCGARRQRTTNAPKTATIVARPRLPPLRTFAIPSFPSTRSSRPTTLTQTVGGTVQMDAPEQPSVCDGNWGAGSTRPSIRPSGTKRASPRLRPLRRPPQTSPRRRRLPSDRSQLGVRRRRGAFPGFAFSRM